jgi:hypothetical protein
MSEAIEIREPEPGSALPVLFRAADPMARIQETIEKADVAGRVIERLGLAQRFGDSERAFLTLHGWQVLGSLYGVVARVEWTRRLEDSTGWEARATCRTIDGQEIGAGEGMCSRSEGRQWGKASDHAIRAMAQTRACRRALQHVLGFVPAMAGLDVADPDAPATRKQVGTLHALAKELGWDHAESHERAGVESFNHLTRGQAGELIDEWSTLAEAVAIPTESSDVGRDGHDQDEAPTTEDEPVQLAAIWAEAIEAFGSKVAVLRTYMQEFQPDGGVRAVDVTMAELRWLLDIHQGVAELKDGG